jgi:DNA-binding transcriptional LysR family regulator
MDTALLESLIAVAETGTITEAARRVHVSQSALSRRLQMLEAELGAELFVRGRHGAELTAVGQQALAHSRSIVARCDEMMVDMADHLGLRQGTVRVGGGATVTSFLLPPAIVSFQADHPGIRFFVKEAGSHEVAMDVASGGVELGVVTLPLDTAEVVVRELVVDQIVLVARRDHPLTGRRVTPAELKRHRFIAFEPGSAIRQIIDARLARAGVEVDVAMELRSIPSILRMVATTDFLAFVSRVALATEPGVQEVPVRGLSVSRKLGLATREGFPLSAAAEAFAARLFEAADRSETTAQRPEVREDGVEQPRPQVFGAR